MTDSDLGKYSPLVQEALEAFRSDSAYAEEMARQAGILRARQEARRDREPVSS